METNRSITVLPARGCRRSRKVIEYLKALHVPFVRVGLESAEG